MAQPYADYKNINKEQLQKDIDAIKETIGDPTWKDFEHLLKLENWGRFATFSGYFIMILISYIAYDSGLNPWAFYAFGLIAATLIAIGNVSRWANVTHPILHGAYDKVPGIPLEYTKTGYAKGLRRWIDWLDWIKPDAWEYEHNIMHHYHLGEEEDPDNVERNLQWLIRSKTPMWLRYCIIYAFAGTWKFTYYAPNTLKILENKERRKRKEPAITYYQINPLTRNGFELWKHYLLPYAMIKFVIIPLLFLPMGVNAAVHALIIMFIAEFIANIHSFLVIVPNHSAEDIYQFSTPHKSQGEFYLRQIMGSVNYHTGSDLIDFLHGWLNYQVEHHLFPNLPLSQYQKMQPIVKEICKKHKLPYRQESVFKRARMSIELMVGKTKLLRIDGV
jgi:fatty acid desaturase